MKTKTDTVRISLEETPEGLYATMLNTEKYLRKSGIPHSLLHLIKVRASQINGCGYCLDMHHKDALKAGETFQRLYLLPAWQESPCFTEEEKAVLHLTEVLTRIANFGVSAVEEAYHRMTRHYSNPEIANIVLAICQINSWNRIVITAGPVPRTYQPAA
jgi:AhpD family alkylhydroperoxidase